MLYYSDLSLTFYLWNFITLKRSLRLTHSCMAVSSIDLSHDFWCTIINHLCICASVIVDNTGDFTYFFAPVPWTFSNSCYAHLKCFHFNRTVIGGAPEKSS